MFVGCGGVGEGYYVDIYMVVDRFVDFSVVVGEDVENVCG